MATIWQYCGDEYETEALVNAAVLNTKSRLDNNPTDWAIVKEISGSVATGWLVPVHTLTDSEINNIDTTKVYSVSSVKHSDMDFGLTSSEATAKVAEHRASYAAYLRVNLIIKYDTVDPSEPTEYAPTNVDMSGYVS